MVICDQTKLARILRRFLVCLCQKEFFCVFCAILRKSLEDGIPAFSWLCAAKNRFSIKERIILIRQNAQCSSGTVDTCLTHLCLLSNVTLSGPNTSKQINSSSSWICFFIVVVVLVVYCLKY